MSETSAHTTPKDIVQTVLIVDDEPINLRLLRAHLQKRGYGVIEAADGQACLTQALNRPDLILLDIMMPGMDGFETCTKLKEDPRTTDIPVIFLSALTDAEVKTRGLEAGGVDYISKPFDSKELLARVKTHLTLRAQERQIRNYADNLESMVEERTRRLSEAEREISRDYAIQSLISELLRISLDNITLRELMERTLSSLLSVTWHSFHGRGCVFLTGGAVAGSEEGAQGAIRLSLIAQEHRSGDALERELGGGDKDSLLCGCARNLTGLDLGEQGEAPLTGKELKALFAASGQVDESLYCVPITYGTRLLGVVNLFVQKGRTPDRKEEDFLAAVANTLARVIVYKQAETRLIESEEQYRNIFENTGTAVAIVEDDLTVSLVNSEFELLSGYSKREFEREPVNGARFVHEEDVPLVQKHHRQRLEDPSSAPKNYEFRFLTRNGDIRHVNITASIIPGTRRTVSSIMDITDKKRAEQALLHHAFHDSLTGLPNRTYLLDAMADELSELHWRAERGAEGAGNFAVLLMDLDRFNMVNESLGHQIGDKLLIASAERLSEIVGGRNLLARLGGDEFAVLVRVEEAEGHGVELAQVILDAIRQPFDLDGNELFTTTSVGIAYGDTSYDSAEDVLRDADAALHRAKLKGKARYEIFDPVMHARARELMALVTDMRLAIERQEFVLHYQPIVDLADGSVNGFEALIRWIHPKRGFISPGEFIPIAEETGLIIPIGAWVLREACSYMVGLYERFGIMDCKMISVNLSGKQFGQEDLFEMVHETLKETGLPPHCLKLEITESVVMDNVEAALEVLERLKSLDVQVSIDDFGTGYSSLSYLHRFPVDMLKIDRSFVSRMTAADENMEIVRTIVALSHGLGLKVIAEGVETEEQRHLLHGLGCEYVQGFFFSKPLPAETLEAEAMPHKVWD